MDETGTRRPNPGRLVELRVADEPSAWVAAGFTVTEDRVRLGDVSVRLTGEPADGRRGITGWTVAGLTITDGLLDGLPTEAAALADPPAGAGRPEPGSAHPNGAVRLDHVVVTTPDLERTIAACETAGLELRRIRDATAFGAPMRQAFFKLGPVVLEVVSGDPGNGIAADDAPAAFWGLAVDVDNLDQTAAALGDGVGRVKAAVQPGRRIATLRHRAHGISVAVALMDDHADHADHADRTDRTPPEAAR